MQRELILCADDYAQSESISTAILCLAKQKRLNAISCMVNMPYWHDAFHELQPYKNSHFIGLHLNLTEGQPLSAAWRMQYGDKFWPLSKLIWHSYTKQLDKKVVMAEIEAQLNLFIQDLHAYPDFIDGHQHVQQFPIISDALIAIYSKQHEMVHGYSEISHFDVDNDPEPHPCFLRHTYNGWQDWFSFQGFPKSQILACLGGMVWHHKLVDNHLFTNTSFGGIYRFDTSRRYRHYFEKSLNKLKSGGIIMCHPGYDTSDEQDAIHQARQHEFEYLSSDYFLQDLEKNAVHLMQKKDLVSHYEAKNEH